MKQFILIIFSFITFLSPIYGSDEPQQKRSDANIIGHVLDKQTGEHLSFINVIIQGTTIGTSTDQTGHYFLKDLPVGKCVIEFKSLGYKTVTKEIILQSGQTIEVNTDLEEDRVSLDAVVVSANRGETTRRMAPLW